MWAVCCLCGWPRCRAVLLLGPLQAKVDIVCCCRTTYVSALKSACDCHRYMQACCLCMLQVH